MYMCTYTCTCVYTRDIHEVYTHRCTCVHIYIHVYIHEVYMRYTHMDVHVYMYTYINTKTHSVSTLQYDIQTLDCSTFV